MDRILFEQTYSIRDYINFKLGPMGEKVAACVRKRKRDCGEKGGRGDKNDNKVNLESKQIQSMNQAALGLRTRQMIGLALKNREACQVWEQIALASASKCKELDFFGDFLLRVEQASRKINDIRKQVEKVCICIYIRKM